MFKAVLRAVHPAGFAARSALKPTSSALRAFSTSSRIFSDHGAPPPQLFGPGAKPGQVPTDEQQATGLERLQLLGELEGVSVFDVNPLDSSRVGTPGQPIIVPSLVRAPCFLESEMMEQNQTFSWILSILLTRCYFWTGFGTAGWMHGFTRRLAQPCVVPCQKG